MIYNDDDEEMCHNMVEWIKLDRCLSPSHIG